MNRFVDIPLCDPIGWPVLQHLIWHWFTSSRQVRRSHLASTNRNVDVCPPPESVRTRIQEKCPASALQEAVSLMKTFVAAFATLAVLTLDAQIPEKNPERNPLAAIKTLKCTFPMSASASWKAGVPQPPLVKNEETSFEVEAIDTQEGSARLVAADPVFITALLTASSMHFMERTLQGSLTVTTVFSIESVPGKLRAVRSRHDYMKMSLPGYVSEPTITQYYGECTPGK